jgi:hypothetical protein
MITRRQALKLGPPIQQLAEERFDRGNTGRRRPHYSRNKLLAAQIIAHHNALLDGFGAGSHAITVKPADEVTF